MSSSFHIFTSFQDESVTRKMEHFNVRSSDSAMWMRRNWRNPMKNRSIKTFHNVFECVCVKSHTFNKSVQSIRIKNNQVRKCLAKAKAKIIDLICLVRLPQVNLPIRTFHSTTARERSFVELYQLRSKLWISFEWNEYEYNGRVSMNSWTKNHHFVKRIQWKQWQN